MLSKNITMPPYFWEKLQELANTNTATSRSRMIALLVSIADSKPSAFGIRERSLRKRSLPVVDVRFTRHGYSKRRNISMSQDEWNIFDMLALPNTKGAKSTLLRHLIVVAYEHAGVTIPLNMPSARRIALRDSKSITSSEADRRMKQETFAFQQMPV